MHLGLTGDAKIAFLNQNITFHAHTCESSSTTDLKAAFISEQGLKLSLSSDGLGTNELHESAL